MLEIIEVPLEMDDQLGRKIRTVVADHFELLTEQEEIKKEDNKVTQSLGLSIKGTIDPMGLENKALPKLQKNAWQMGWVESNRYKPEDFADRIFTLSMFRIG